MFLVCMFGFKNSTKKSPFLATIPIQSRIWLELGYGNITFTDELDFDVAELDIVYEDSDEGGVDIIAEKDGVHLGAQARRYSLVS